MAGVRRMKLPELRSDAVEKAYHIMEKAMCEAINEVGINYYEMSIALAMLDANVKAQNVASYIQVEVTKLDRDLNNKMRITREEQEI